MNLASPLQWTNRRAYRICWIEIDTQVGIRHFPADKLSQLKDLLSQWSSRRSCRRQQLESLIGTQQHACWVLKPGRTFLQQVINLLCTPSATKGHHHIMLNFGCCANLQWWSTFTEHWNGLAMFPCTAGPTFTVTSDASGSWGCGAWSGPHWFQFEGLSDAWSHHISSKQFFAGLLSCEMWGKL